MQEKSNYPFLICPGAQKSGTTYLFNLLRQSKNICFSDQKETQFFSHDNKYKNGIESYFKKFRPNKETKYLADFSQSYLANPVALRRIKKHIGDNVRFVIILRDPIKRAFSNYKMIVLDDMESRTFDEVIKEEIYSIESYRNIVERGMYAAQLDYLFSLYSKEQVLIFEFSEFTENPNEIVRKIYDFLKIDSQGTIKYKVGRYKSRDRKISGIGKKLYYLPAEKRQFFLKNGFTNLIYRGIIFISRKKLKVKFKLEQSTVDLLSEHYRESNRILSEKYGVDTSDWL